MKKATILKSWILAVVILFLVASLPSTAYSLRQGEQNSKWNDPSTPITTSIKIDHIPVIGESANVDCTISSALDAPETKAEIILPEGAELRSGNPIWEGDISGGSSVTISISVIFLQTGNTTVTCKALRLVSESESWGDLSQLFMDINSDVSSLGFEPVGKRSEQAKLVNQSGQQISEDISALAGALTVTGRWMYYDRSGAQVGASRMYVELTTADSSYTTLAWCATDTNGYFSCGPFTNPGSVGIMAWLSTYSQFGPYNDRLVVVNPASGTDPSLSEYNYYQVGTSALTLSDGTQDIGTWSVTSGSTTNRAFWVLRDLGNAWWYIWNATGSTQSPQETTGPATVQWNNTSTDGTYYIFGEQIHLDASDPLSNTVVNHEYSHNIMYNKYGGWMPTTYCPSPHYINKASHVNCAWTEGWANFLTLAVNNDPIYRWDSGASLNLETPTWNTPSWDSGDNVEGRVAGALWDILDSGSEGYDQYSEGTTTNIWDTLFHQADNNFNEFWPAWLSRGHNKNGAMQSLYQNTIPYGFNPGWAGGAKIQSTQNVVVIGRPHLGTEVMAYNGFASGSYTMYLPMLFKQAWGSYDSAFYVQNVDATAATVTINFYDSNGNSSCTISGETIAPQASKGYWVPSLTCLPSGWVGGAVITSNKLVVAVGRPHIGSQITTYDGFSGGSLKMYLPMLFKTAWGSYDSAFYVQNVDTSNSANITIQFYDTAGVQTCSKTDTIAKLASKGYWVPSEPCLPMGWVGSAVITSNNSVPIVAIGRPHVGAQVTTYNGFSAGNLTSNVPMIFKNMYGNYNTALYIQNVDPTNTASITVTFYNTDGSSAWAFSDTISKLSSKGYWMPSLSDLPASWVGNVTITSNYSVIAVSRAHIGDEIATFGGFSAGSTNMYAPMLFKAAWGIYDSAFYVRNITDSSANVTISFYDADGNLTCVRGETISARASSGYWVPSVACNQ